MFCVFALFAFLHKIAHLCSYVVITYKSIIYSRENAKVHFFVSVYHVFSYILALFCLHFATFAPLCNCVRAQIDFGALFCALCIVVRE